MMARTSTFMAGAMMAVLALLGTAQALATIGPKGSRHTVTLSKVVDGDTLYAKNATGYEFRFRFACIDAPETFHVPYGTYSKNNLSALVAPLGSAIDVLVYQRNDGYSRSVVEVFKAGVNVNLRMLQIAQAFVEPSWVYQCNVTAYYEAANDGKATGTGVWSVPGGIPRPWDCRKNRTLCSTTTTGRKLMDVTL